MKIKTVIYFVFVLGLVTGGGCNRAWVRVPGAALPFPETATHYKAKKTCPYSIVVLPPIDRRSAHYGEYIADSRWKACPTDAIWIWNKDVSSLIQERLINELDDSGMFSAVGMVPAGPNDIIMRTKIEAFCSQAVGFIFIRVAGITSLQVTLEQNGKILLDRKFDKVVTDGDKEFTGSPVSFIEQVMRETMTDSLRELMADMLNQFDTTLSGGQNSYAQK